MGRWENLGSLKLFPWYTAHISGGMYLISWVSSGLTIGSGCSLMAARWQVFISFLSFLRDHWLTLESCLRCFPLGQEFDQYLGDISWSNLVPCGWEAHPRSGENSWYINPSVNFWIWRRKWLPTPVLLPGKFHEWRSLVGYSPWGRKESEQLHWFTG